MAQRYEYQDIDGHVILLFVHPAEKAENFELLLRSPLSVFCFLFDYISQPRALAPRTAALAPSNSLSRILALPL